MNDEKIETNADKITIERAELRRLEKALKDKDKNKMVEWAEQFGQQIAYKYERKYREIYKEDLDGSLETFILTIIYTLHFNESTKFGAKRIDSFMKDLMETVDMFRRGEADPEDYRKQLAEDNIIVKK